MDRIALKNDEQTTIAIGFLREGKSTPEVGDTIAVFSEAVTLLSAAFNLETGLVDVIPVDGAVGPADVRVVATLADGTVLPEQRVGYDVQHPEADTLVLSPGSIVPKAVSIVVPVQNVAPVVIPAAETEPVPEDDDAAKADDEAETAVA